MPCDGRWGCPRAPGALPHCGTELPRACVGLHQHRLSAASPLALWTVLLNGSSFNPSERPRRKQLAVSGSSPEAQWQPSDDGEIGSLQRASISPKARMGGGRAPWDLCCMGSSPHFGDEDRGWESDHHLAKIPEPVSRRART